MELLFFLYLLFIASVVIQFFFYGCIFKEFVSYQPKNQTFKSIPVSIIICAKNEAKNLEKFLPYVLNQDYSKFEVVLINDGSRDSTLKVMHRFKDEYNNIRIVDVKPNENFYSNKKIALTLGIKAATYNYLLFTDADCKPISSEWVKNMVSHFSKEHLVVLGYGAYKKIQGSFLNKLIRYETLLTATQYFSYALHRMPYMGVGRNLSYSKELFANSEGFINHIKVKSGDDDLLIGAISNKTNTTICIESDSFTFSEPKKSLKDWIYQKRRHITTASYYSFKHKMLLGSFYSSQILFYLLASLLLIIGYNTLIVLLLIFLRMSLYIFIMIESAKKLGEYDLRFTLPILEISVIAMQLYIFIINLISKPKHWN